MEISLISLDAFSGSLGLRSISACLKKRGHTVKVIFLIPDQRFNYDPSLSFKTLQELTGLVKNSGIIGISCMTNEVKTCISVIDYLKKMNKPIVWGGIHATSCPEECIKYADMVCIGEGEEAFCELVETMEKGLYYLDTKNFWLKKDGHVIKNPIRPLLQELDSLPIPDYECESHYILEKAAIVKATPYYNALDSILIHSTRGCPNRCSYCCNSFLRELYLGKGEFIRSKSAEVIIKELEYYKDNFPKLRYIWFTDDTMFVKTARDLKIFAEEYKENINLPFQCYVSPNTCDEEKLKMLLDAGLRKLEMGIQTGSEDISRNIYSRTISNVSIIEAAQTINKYKMKMDCPNYQVLFCNPYETEEDLIKTIVLLQKLPPPFHLQVFPLQFFPASKLYEKAKSEGILKENILVNYHDRIKALRLNVKEGYLNFIFHLINGTITSKKMGYIPTFLIAILINKNIINFFKNHGRALPFLIDINIILSRIKQFLKSHLIFIYSK